MNHLSLSSFAVMENNINLLNKVRNTSGLLAILFKKEPLIYQPFKAGVIDKTTCAIGGHKLQHPTPSYGKPLRLSTIHEHERKSRLSSKMKATRRE